MLFFVTALRHPLPTVAKRRLGSFLRMDGGHPLTAFTHDEEQRLVVVIRDYLKDNHVSELAQLHQLASGTAAGIPQSNPQVRSRLPAKFSKAWVSSLVAAHSIAL